MRVFLRSGVADVRRAMRRRKIRLIGGGLSPQAQTDFAD